MPDKPKETLPVKEKGQKVSDDQLDADDIDGLKQILEEKIRRHRYLQVIVFMIILGLDIADLLSDWLFYADVSIAEQGLVYGLPDQGAVIALLFFSIIGTITFIFEVCNLGKEIFTGKPWFNVDLVTMIIIWIEDIPQIGINVFIALCREDPISVFQLTKASVIILGIILRIIISLARYCSKESIAELKKKTKMSRVHVTYHVFIMLGLILNFAGASAIFFFTQTQRDLDGKIVFEIPDTIFEDKYNDDRYFKNVSIYFHHPTFDIVEPNNASDANWMRLITINSVRNLPDKVVMFNYEYRHTASELQIVLWENNNNSLWEAIECYSIDKTTAVITKHSNCGSFLSGDRISIIFKFSFIPPDRVFRKLVFGDIRFNAKYSNNNDLCESISSDNITDSIEEGLKEGIDITVHYYRTTVSEDSHIILKNGTRFYRQEDLVDITEVWETGWLNCETKGSLAPHVDSNIDPPCSTN
ncbi:uncharacterized protein [Haliotis cracherodii]|uniref:uncharacterized protein n=1 Tax=Haliotis cracherodii TaxID=6455 RepID=UPI0039EBE22A